MSDMQPHNWPLSMRPKLARAHKPYKDAKPSGAPRKATAKQRLHAREMGLVISDDITAAEITGLINAALESKRQAATQNIVLDSNAKPSQRLADATPGDMIRELHRRGMPAVLLAYSSRSNKELRMFFDGMTEAEAQGRIIALGSQFAKDRSPQFAAFMRPNKD